MLNLLFLAAALADTTATPPAARQAAPAVAVHRQPGLPVVALRLSLLADDPRGFAGAGHLIQHLQLPAMEEQAARVGGRVQAIRTSDALVYTVTGPASELGYLAGILRGALRVPQPAQPQLLVALNALSEERDEERETAASYVRAALRQRIFPDELPASGTPSSAARLESAALDALWGELYSPDRVSVVAVGNVGADEVTRAFRDLPGSGEARLTETLADTAPSFASDTPQATRAWAGWAAPAPGNDAAALSVAARLVRNRLRRTMPSSAVEVEHWWTHRGHALAIVAATAGERAATARRTVAGAVAGTAAALDDEAVRDAAAGVRRDLLFYSRTPERMAQVLGAFADRGENADAAQRFFAALDAVTVNSVRAVLEAVGGRDAATVNVAPQRLVPN
jgi:predicted Zn-dependent peptidase